VERPRNWATVVNERMDEGVVEQLGVSVRRGRPFGGDQWIKRVVNRYGLEGTVRDPWRPSTKPRAQGREAVGAGNKGARTALSR